MDPQSQTMNPVSSLAEETSDLAVSPRDGRREAQKDLIRRVAGKLFRDQGFDATVRQIAAIAGVNPAIVIRHFGSKETLFLQTMSAEPDFLSMLDGPLEHVGRAVVTEILDRGQAGWRTYAALVRASDRPDVAAQLKQIFADDIAPRLAPRLSGEDAIVRAHLFTAQLTGLLTALSIYQDERLSGASREAIITLYGDSMQRLLVP